MPRALVTSPAVAFLALGAVLLSSCSGGSGASSGSSHAAGNTATTARSRVIPVTVTAAKGCTAPAGAYPAGALTVKVRNTDATGVSEVELLSGERIVGEKENLPPGFSGEFTVDVPAGRYTLYCPGGTPERSTLTVTGHAAGTVGQHRRRAAQERDRRLRHLRRHPGRRRSSPRSRSLDTALHGTNLAAAQTAYMKARPFYEKIEPVAESFVQGSDSLDTDIDARIGDTTFAEVARASTASSTACSRPSRWPASAPSATSWSRTSAACRP